MGGLSRDPDARRRQLSNLRRGGTLAPGNQHRLVHGGRAEVLLRDVTGELRELLDALAEAAPVREQDGSVPPADVVALERCARALKRWRHVSTWCDLHGRLTDKGEVKPAARYELDAENALARALEALGLGPAARLRLGVDLARAGSELGRYLDANYPERDGGGA